MQPTLDSTVVVGRAGHADPDVNHAGGGRAHRCVIILGCGHRERRIGTVRLASVHHVVRGASPRTIFDLRQKKSVFHYPNEFPHEYGEGSSTHYIFNHFRQIL